MSRLTPFDLAFGGELENRFEMVTAESAASLKDPTDLAQFVSLPSVQQLIGEIESPELLAHNPAAAREYHMLLYAAYRYWSSGKTVLVVGRDTLSADESAVDESVLSARPPRGACYVQLPERQVWAQVEDGVPHEPLDGIFVAQSASEQQICFVAILGLRPDRAGFSQISTAVAPRELAALPQIVQSPYFVPTMEGGDLAGFKSVNSIGELLLLSQLALAQAKR